MCQELLNKIWGKLTLCACLFFFSIPLVSCSKTTKAKILGVPSLGTEEEEENVRD